MEIQKIDEETLEKIKLLILEENAIGHEKSDFESPVLERIDSIKL